MAFAVNSDLIGRSPCPGIKLPRISPRDAQLITALNLEALAEAMDDYGPMVYLGAVMGLRGPRSPDCGAAVSTSSTSPSPLPGNSLGARRGG